MNKVSQNGMKVTQTAESVKVNGSNRLEMINGQIKINGFVFNPKTGEFKKSFPFIWIFLVIVVAILTIKILIFL